MTIVGGETSHGLGAFFGLCSGNCFSGSASGSTPYLAGTFPAKCYGSALRRYRSPRQRYQLPLWRYESALRRFR